MKVTPIGKLTGFVAIERPSTKFDEAGVYSCQVAFAGDSAKKIKSDIDELMAQSLANGKTVTKPFEPPYTIEGKELIVKFKQKAKIVSKTGESFTSKVRIFDSKNQEMSDVGMGAGSTVIIAYKPYLWAVKALGCGVTLQLRMVQVLDLVKIEGFGASPFDSTEGFVASVKEDDPFDTDKNDWDF